MGKYEIKDENGKEVEKDVLIIHYGGDWENVLDRLGSTPNGHVVTIHHQGDAYKVYRKLV